MTKILFLGDIFGRPGRQMVRDFLPALVGREEIDLSLANGENASGGLGLDAPEAQELFDYGLAALTGGNHTFHYKNGVRLLDSDERLVRPANYPSPCPGRGWTIVETPGGVKVGIGNIMGRVFINNNLDHPFLTADRILNEMKEAGAHITIIDFHAEATSEKRALAHYLDGRVGAVFGTHTHVPTADAQISSQHTASITDLGMCGAHQSIIGMSYESVLPTFITGRPHRFEPATRGSRLQGVIVTFDEQHKPTDIVQVNIPRVTK